MEKRKLTYTNNKGKRGGENIKRFIQKLKLRPKGGRGNVLKPGSAAARGKIEKTPKNYLRKLSPSTNVPLTGGRTSNLAGPWGG